MCNQKAMKKEKEIFVIHFLNKEKKFRPDSKEFKTEKAAEKWGKKNLSNFHPDLIKIY